MSAKKKNDGKVGFGNPPAGHQFKPGQSGNPKGRPKGSRNKWNKDTLHLVDSLANIISDEAVRDVLIREAGKETNISTLQAIIRSMGVDAINHKSSAQRDFLNLTKFAFDHLAKQKQEFLEVVINYKFGWAEILEECRQTGRPEPKLPIHPDDIHIDPESGEVQWRCKSSDDDEDEQLKFIKKGIVAQKENIIFFEEILAEFPDDKMAQADLARAKDLLDRIKIILPELFDELAAKKSNKK